MSKKSQQTTLDKINDLIQTLRVYINFDGGDVEFVSYKDHILTLKMKGACATCPWSTNTYDQGIKQVLLEEIKDIKDVKFIL